jgi:hypothetical protein
MGWNDNKTAYTISEDLLTRYTEATLSPIITGPNLTTEDTDNSVGAGANQCITSINNRLWIHADSGGGMTGFDFFVSNFVRRPKGKKEVDTKKSVSLAGVGSSKNKYQVAIYEEVGFRTPDGIYIIANYEYDFGDSVKGQLMSIDNISSREFHDYCQGITVKSEEVTRDEFVKRHGMSPIYDGFYSKSYLYNNNKFNLNLFDIRTFVRNRYQNNDITITIDIDGESMKCPKLVYPTSGKAVVQSIGQLNEGTNELVYNYHTIKTKQGGVYNFEVYQYEAIRASATNEIDELEQKANGKDNIHKDFDKLEKPLVEILSTSRISCYDIDVVTKARWEAFLNNLKFKVVMTADSPNVPFSADKTKSADTEFAIQLRKYLKKLIKDMGWESKTGARQKSKQETNEVIHWLEILKDEEHETHSNAIMVASKLWGVSPDEICNSKLEEDVKKVYNHDIDFRRNDTDLVEWQINRMDDEHYTELIARLIMPHKFKTVTWVHGEVSPLQMEKLETVIKDFGRSWYDIRGIERIQVIYKSDLYKPGGFNKAKVYHLNTY